MTSFFQVRAVEMYTKERKESDPNARVILTVNDVNDNAPRFRKSFYSFQIKDNLGFHELVHPVSIYVIKLMQRFPAISFVQCYQDVTSLLKLIQYNIVNILEVY